MAELSQQYQTRPSLAEEFSELATIRDQLERILDSLLQRTEESQLPPEFPTVSAAVHRLNTVARQIARTSKGDPHRHHLLNEMTTLCFMADLLCKREL